MPFVLHPSGYCVWFNEKSKGNLITGEACPLCKRTAGHKLDCIYYKEPETSGASARPKLYNATALLWHRCQAINFITFTLPSRPGLKVYQASPHCEETGDLAVTAIFSKMLEAIAVKLKREAPPNAVNKFSYVWIAEAQKKRQEKFGGAADLHFHLLTGSYINIQWLQATWSSYFPGCPDFKNSVDLQAVPPGVQSIPAYLCKYLGKGSSRRIYSRRFSCSRDLSALVPIHVTHLPSDLQPITTKIVTQANGYESALYYFNTGAVLKRFGRFMVDEKDFKGTRGGRNFTPGAIASRAFKRERVQAQKKYAEENGLLPFVPHYL